MRWVRRQAPRGRRLTAAATAVLMVVTGFAALPGAEIPVRPPARPGPPTQPPATAAGRSHRLPASATIGAVNDGQVLPGDLPQTMAGRAARAAQALREAVPRKGAVPPAAQPPTVNHGTGPASETVSQLPAPAAPTVTGYGPRTSTTLAGQTSADRSVYQNADGTRTAKFSNRPVNYQLPDGSWAPIRTDLVSASGTGAAPPSTSAPSSTAPAPAGWREQAAAQPLSFAAYADGSPLLDLPLGGSRSVGLRVQGAAHAPGAASGATVTYPGVRPDASLKVLAGVASADLQVVLDSVGAPDTWVFPLNLRGLAARTGSDGSIEFTAAGRVVAAIPHGLMTDSTVDPRSGDGAVSTGVDYALVTVGAEPALRMTLDAAWLHAPARVFPVTVDPSVQALASGGTTYVQSGSSADNSGGPEIKAGTWNGGTNVTRSLLNFAGVSSSLRNDTVLGVRLGVFNSWSYSCSARPVTVYPVTTSWSVTGSKSYPGPSIGGPVGSKSFATGWVPLGSTVSPCPAAWEGIDLNRGGTDLVNGWTHGTVANNGLALGASTSDSYGWKKFSSSNSATGNPFLSVTYTPYGARYALAASQPVAQVSPTQNGKLAIRVTNTGADTWTPTNGFELSYAAYDSHGHLAANHPVFTPVPSTVAPGQTVTIKAVVNSLQVGDYALNFDMYAKANTTAPVSYLSQGIRTLAVRLHVPQPPPVVTAVYPPTGYISPTVTPELSTSAFSTTNTPITYVFSLSCEPLPGTVCPASTITSGSLTVPYWTPPTPMTWNEPYLWTVRATTNGVSTTIGPVTITPQVPQPQITSGLGGSAGKAYEPQSGNFTTGATEAAVTVAGPPLQLDRTYNSLDPRVAGAFGAGWSGLADTSVTPDNDGSGSVLVSLPSGRQMRFGVNAGLSTYAAPSGNPDVLAHNSDGTWTLMDTAAEQYQFTSGGALSQLTNAQGLAQQFTSNSAGQITKITDVASGRSLALTWSTPSGAAHPHVASVTTSPPASGQSGLTWSYTYAGDNLTGVCNPAGGCTSYGYGAGSNYRSSVLDAGPRSYWQLGDPSGSTGATDEVDTNLGTTGASYQNVTLEAAGPLAGSSQTAASFNGTSSSVSLPANLIEDQTYLSVGLWFKAGNATASGVLFGYQADALTNANGNTDPHVPALYVGGNGKLYGQLSTGSIQPMASSVNVADGNWHYAVLNGSGTSQTLWLDGTQIGTLSGQITPKKMSVDTVGAGFWQGGWPSSFITVGPTLQSTPIGYFDGSIAQVAVYPHPQGGPAIARQYALGKASSPELTSVTVPSGRVSQRVSYDAAQDRVATYTDPAGGQWQIHPPLTTGYRASSDSLQEAVRSVTVTSPAGYDQVYGYDPVNGGRLISFTPGNGDAPATFGYDAAGFMNQVTDSDGNLTTMTNDIRGNVLSRSWYPVQPAGLTAGARPAAPAAASAATSASCATNGAPCTTYYAYFSNLANPLDPRNNKLTSVSDARSASAIDTTYRTSYAYSVAGQQTTSTTPATSDFPGGRSATNAYTTSSTAAVGGGTTPPGLLLSSTSPGRAVTSYGYYSNGDLAQVTQPSGATTAYTYDGLGRALSATTTSDSFPGGLTTSYAYTFDNQQSTVTYPAVTNQVTGATVTHTLRKSYAYNADAKLLSLTQTDLTGGDPARVTSYTYDDHGQVASLTQPGGATAGGGTQPEGASSSNPAGATTGYTYNDSGLVATMTDPNGNEYGYTYNEYGKLTQTTLVVNSTSASVPGGGSSLVLSSSAYDPAGLLAAATDAMGRTTNYFYDSRQKLLASRILTSAGTGRQTAYHYDGPGNLISTDASDVPVTTANQTVTDNTYDAANRLTTVAVDPVPAGTSSSGYVNRVTSYAYNADNLVTAQTVTGSGGSATVHFGYDNAGERTSRSAVNGSVSDTTTWTYNQLGQQTSMTSPDGNAAGATPANFTTNYAYDQAGYPAKATGPPVATQTYTAQSPVTTRPVTAYGYNTFWDQTQVKDPLGNLSTSTYDGGGRVLAATQPAYSPPGSSSAITATTSYAYDENGNRTAVTDPKGNTTRYSYDTLGDPLTQTDPQLTGRSAPGVWTYTYDNDGEQLTATSPTGAKTLATYNEFGDKATATQAVRGSDGTAYNTTSYTYDYQGNQLTATSPDGVLTTNTYDHLGEPASTKDDVGNTTSYAYDYAGRVAQVANPDTTFVTYRYDGAGNRTGVNSYGVSGSPGELPPVLATQSMAYDASGNMTSRTDPDNHTTMLSYDAAGNLTTQVQPVSASTSNTTSFGYDAVGNQSSVTGGRGNTTWTSYNSWGLAESLTEPATPQAPNASQRTWTTAYDAAGQPVTVTQPGAITQTYGYDQLGNLTSQSGSGASAPTTARTFGYDPDGNLTTASAPGGTDTFTYNDAGQVTATSGPSGTASFTYNPDLLMTAGTDAAGSTTYTYDSADRPATVKEPLTGSTMSYGYNANSLPATVSYTTGGVAGPKRSLAYDGLQRLTTDTLATPGATVASASYRYDPNGNLISQTTAGYAGSGSTAYGFDQANELTSATTGGTATTYGYDADGDLIQSGPTTYGYNAQGQPVNATASAGKTTYGYTLSGGLSSVTPPSGTAQNYTSDAYGQTIAVPGGISYAYDALGRLATRTASGSTATFAYSGAGSTVASDGSATYTHDPSGGVIADKPAGGTAGAALTDIHGNLTGTFSPAGGTTGLAASTAYTPYGGVAARSGTMPSLGYQGQYTDPSSGNTDMSARWYSPSTGTFTSNDTITGMPDPTVSTPTAFGYAAGNPLTNTDPSGHCISCPIIGAIWGPAAVAVYCATVGCGGGGGHSSAGGHRAESGGQGNVGHPAERGSESSRNYGERGSTGGGGGSGGCWSCGGSWGGGGGSGGGWWHPAPPPPPPPPPQDCYAVRTCAPPKAPTGLKSQIYHPDPPHSTTDPAKIPIGLRINQPTPTEEQLRLQLGLGEIPTGLGSFAGVNGSGSLFGGDPWGVCILNAQVCQLSDILAQNLYDLLRPGPDYVTAELTMTDTFSLPLGYSFGDKVQVGVTPGVTLCPAVIGCTMVPSMNPRYSRVGGKWNTKKVTISTTVGLTVTRSGSLFLSVGVPYPQGKEGDPPVVLSVRKGHLFKPTHATGKEIDDFVGGWGSSVGVNSGHSALGYSTTPSFDQWAFEAGFTTASEPSWGVGWSYAGLLKKGVVPAW